MKKIKAQIAVLFMGKYEGKDTLMMGMRFSVDGGTVSVPLGSGLYAVFSPCESPILDFTALYSVLPEFETEQCVVLQFKGTETQATHPVLYPSGALVQPSEVRTAQISQMFSLGAKELARLESAQATLRECLRKDRDAAHSLQRQADLAR